MAINKQDIIDAYNQVYIQDNSDISRSFEDLSLAELIISLLFLLISNCSLITNSGGVIRQLVNIGNQTLTSPNRSSGFICNTLSNFTCSYTITNIGTSTVTVIVEGSTDNINWFNLDSLNNSFTNNSNGTFSFMYSNICLYSIRFNWVSKNGNDNPIINIKFIGS